MRTPVTSLPVSVSRWASRARALRWADAVGAAAAIWALIAATMPARTLAGDVAIALTLLGGAACVPALRRRWRPVSALVGIIVSRGLKPGDRAWYVRPDGAERVLVTACRLNRVVIATSRPGATEGFTVRRTRVLLIPAG